MQWTLCRSNKKSPWHWGHSECLTWNQHFQVLSQFFQHLILQMKKRKLCEVQSLVLGQGHAKHERWSLKWHAGLFPLLDSPGQNWGGTVGISGGLSSPILPLLSISKGSMITCKIFFRK
jgi:hypothetical protein